MSCLLWRSALPPVAPLMQDCQASIFLAGQESVLLTAC